MNEFIWPGRLPRRPKRALRRMRTWVMVAAPLAAILFQVYVPLYLAWLRFLEMPLLVTIYLAISRRSQIFGAAVGAVVGMLQDALSNQPIGVFGMVKTVMGFSAASVGVRLDTEHPAVRAGLVFFAFLLHQGIYWSARRMLLGETPPFEPLATLLAAPGNAAAAALLFHLLDKLRDGE